MDKKFLTIGICIILTSVFIGCAELEPNAELKLNAEISGPTIGYIGEQLIFQGNASGGTPPYSFIWDLDNDGDYDDATGETIFFSKNYSQGVYSISLKVTDDKDNEIIKNFTITIFTKDEENNPPNTPGAPIGQTIGNVGTVYTYSQSTTDPDGDLIKYRFDWDDNTYSDWSDLMASDIYYYENHSWENPGIYEIKVIAEDSEGKQSNWSSSLVIEIQESDSGEVTYPSVKFGLCSPLGPGFELKPTLPISIDDWIVFNKPDFEIPDLLLKLYVKYDGLWVGVKDTVIPGNLDIENCYYYFFSDADQYSTTYYLKAELIDDIGVIISQASFSFTTVDNTMPILNVISLCNWHDCSIKPTVIVEISDKYEDEMDLEWYLKKEGESFSLVHIDQSLTNGSYSYRFENANEYATRYYWKVIVTDEYGLSGLEKECSFYTRSPEVSISNIFPLDGTTFYVYVNNDGTSSVASPLTFNATISNSEGNNMDIEFVYYSQSTGTVTDKTQNIDNGTYDWTPTEKLLYVGDSPWFYVKVTDIECGKHTTSGSNNIDIQRVWVQFAKNDTDNSLTVTYIEPSGFSWNEIELNGIGNLPIGTISVGDKITECSGIVDLYWVEVGFLIDSWTFV